MNPSARYWKVYGETQRRFGSPLPVVAEMARMLKPERRIWDIGANEGRHALYLAARNHHVTASDRPGKEITTLETVSRRYNLPGAVVQGDILHQIIDEEFHGVVCTFVLNFFQRSEAYNIIHTMMDHTLPGGVNAASLMVNTGGYYDLHAKEGWYPSPSKVRRIWDDWKILFYAEDWRTTVFQSNTGLRLRNYCVHLLAKKTW